MLTCDKCGSDGAITITLGFKAPSNISGRYIEKRDICPNCLLNLAIRLLDRLPQEEKIPFFQQFMNGVIV